MGFLSDRVGRRKVLIPAVIVFSLMSAFSGMAGGLVGLLVIRAVMGCRRAGCFDRRGGWRWKPRTRNGEA